MCDKQRKGSWSYNEQAQVESEAVLLGVQDACLASEESRGFYQTDRPGLGNKERWGSWSYFG